MGRQKLTLPSPSAVRPVRVSGVRRITGPCFRYTQLSHVKNATESRVYQPNQICSSFLDTALTSAGGAG